MTKRAGSDVDGVWSGLYQYAQQLLGLDPALYTSYFFRDSYGQQADEDMVALFDLPRTWVELPPAPGAEEASALLGETPLMFVTQLPKRFRLLREWWIENTFPALRHWGLSMVDTKEGKVGVCQDLGITHMIEDHLKTAKQLHDAGIASYIVKLAEGDDPECYLPFDRDRSVYPEIPRVTLPEYARLVAQR